MESLTQINSRVFSKNHALGFGTSACFYLLLIISFEPTQRPRAPNAPARLWWPLRTCTHTQGTPEGSGPHTRARGRNVNRITSRCFHRSVALAINTLPSADLLGFTTEHLPNMHLPRSGVIVRPPEWFIRRCSGLELCLTGSLGAPVEVGACFFG